MPEEEFITLKECEELTGFTGSGLRGRKDFPRSVPLKVPQGKRPAGFRAVPAPTRGQIPKGSLC